MPVLLSLLIFLFHLSLTKENTRADIWFYARDSKSWNFLTIIKMEHKNIRRILANKHISISNRYCTSHVYSGWQQLYIMDATESFHIFTWGQKRIHFPKRRSLPGNFAKTDWANIVQKLLFYVIIKYEYSEVNINEIFNISSYKICGK